MWVSVLISCVCSDVAPLLVYVSVGALSWGLLQQMDHVTGLSSISCWQTFTLSQAWTWRGHLCFRRWNSPWDPAGGLVSSDGCFRSYFFPLLIWQWRLIDCDHCLASRRLVRWRPHQWGTIRGQQSLAVDDDGVRGRQRGLFLHIVEIPGVLGGALVWRYGVRLVGDDVEAQACFGVTASWGWLPSGRLDWTQQHRQLLTQRLTRQLVRLP